MNTTTHMIAPLPFARSYWVTLSPDTPSQRRLGTIRPTGPHRLLAGFYPGDRDPAVARGKLNALLDCGVTHILNLMESTEGDHAGRLFDPYEEMFLRLADERRSAANWMRRPIRDLNVPTIEQMTTTLDTVDDALAAGGCIYVHCWGGKGRTGTVVGCWLARHGEIEPVQQLRRLTAHARRHFPCIPETPQQQAFVRNWRLGQ
jgi:hypothetical protein